jgi:2-phospho-L-lactate guanylyltransferase
MNAAVVPVKALVASKSRLLGKLGPAQREALCLAMMSDVVAALVAVPSLHRVVVATPDEEVARAARSLGAEAFQGPDDGLNPAIESAAERLSRQGERAVLTVLGDVAAAESGDFERLIVETLAAAGDEGMAVGLAASSDGGTAALCRAPANAIAARFGPQSATRHREEAARGAVKLVELDLPSLRIDLDEAEDVHAFLARKGGGPRTRQVLADIGWTADDPSPETRS